MHPGDNSEWIEWGGGECPVGQETEVEIRLRVTGAESVITAANCDWLHVGDGFGDIIAYRVVSK
jgi:hypothetical protein